MKVVGDDAEVEMLDMVPPSESPLNHLLAGSIKKTVARHKPGAFLMPLLLPGSTDGAFLRKRGTVVYGFTPVLPIDDIGLAHGHNEKISLQSLEFSLNAGLETVLDFIL
jgi:acetylornithine deacetylase/succinyl-diaminopimelate desuccinylase-like protein